MAKLDKNNRLLIPQKIMELSTTDFKDEIRLYMNGNDFFLDNPSKENFSKYCLGKVSIDSKNRIVISKFMQEIIRISKDSNISCFLYEGKATFRVIKFIPEMR